MQILQKQLHSASPERKVLFTLLDAHIFKKCGNTLESASSLMGFIKQTADIGMRVSSFNFHHMVEMALVQLLSLKQEPIYLPFELVKHLGHLFWETDQATRDNFQK